MVWGEGSSKGCFVGVIEIGMRFTKKKSLFPKIFWIFGKKNIFCVAFSPTPHPKSPLPQTTPSAPLTFNNFPHNSSPYHSCKASSRPRYSYPSPGNQHQHHFHNINQHSIIWPVFFHSRPIHPHPIPARHHPFPTITIVTSCHGS